jgi:hypothetical protein
MTVRDGASLDAGADPTALYIAVMGFSGLPVWSRVIISNRFALVNMCVGCNVLYLRLQSVKLRVYSRRGISPEKLIYVDAGICSAVSCVLCAIGVFVPRLLLLSLGLGAFQVVGWWGSCIFNTNLVV